MVEFKLFGIPVRVEMEFWITIGILGALSTSLREDPHALLNIALFMLAAFVSILVHELGHALMIRKYKLPTQIVLSSFGGYATHPVGYLTRTQSFLVTAAGPALQALSAVLILGLLVFGGIEAPRIVYLLKIYYLISIFWAVLNCIPVLPLDGGRMLSAILGPRRQSLTMLVGLIVAGIVSVLGILTGQFFIAIFMGMFAYQNYQGWKQLKKRF